MIEFLRSLLDVFRDVIGDVLGESNQNSDPTLFVAGKILGRHILVGQSQIAA
jgi:phage/plasmid-associated DNA primase